MVKFKKLPVGLAVIIILFYILAAITFIAGISIFNGVTAYFLFFIIKISFMVYFYGFVYMVIGIFSLLVGLGLKKTKKWSRIGAFVLIFLGIANSLGASFSRADVLGGSIFFAIVLIGLSIWIGIYLLTNKSTRKVFS